MLRVLVSDCFVCLVQSQHWNERLGGGMSLESKVMICIKIDLFESRQSTWCEWVFLFCSCTLSNAWWGCYLLVSWVALCANSRQQLAAVRSQQEERESTQLWKTLSRFYKLDLADGVDGGSGQARRRLRGKLAFVDHLSGMTTMVVPWQRAIREGTLRKISKHYLL